MEEHALIPIRVHASYSGLGATVKSILVRKESVLLQIAVLYSLDQFVIIIEWYTQNLEFCQALTEVQFLMGHCISAVTSWMLSAYRSLNFL